jgi:hypothetical protein
MKIEVFIINDYAREGDKIHGVSKEIKDFDNFKQVTHIRVLPKLEAFRIEKIIYDLPTDSYELHLSIEQYVVRDGKMTEQDRETLLSDFNRLVKKFGWEYVRSNTIHQIK